MIRTACVLFRKAPLGICQTCFPESPCPTRPVPEFPFRSTRCADSQQKFATRGRLATAIAKALDRSAVRPGRRHCHPGKSCFLATLDPTHPLPTPPTNTHLPHPALSPLPLP